MVNLFSVNGQVLVRNGVAALNAKQNKLAMLNGNVESVEYRKSCFPELRFWMASVFNANRTGLISDAELISIMTYVRDKAVNGILGYRAKQVKIAEADKALIKDLEAKLAIANKVIRNQGRIIQDLKVAVSNIEAVTV